MKRNGIHRIQVVGSCDGNGRRLRVFSIECQLAITKTIFHQKDCLKAEWMHPRSKQWHLLTYVILRQRNTKDVLQPRAMPRSKFCTGHPQVRLRLKLYFKPKTQEENELK